MANVNYTPDRTIADFIQSYTPGELYYSFIVGPYGCLAPETLVITEYGAIPISRIDRPMRVLSWNEKTRQFQLSQCAGSFLKGTDFLYRVSTSSGEFDAAGEHRLLGADGEYRRVEDLRQGHAVKTYLRDQHPTIAELCQQESVADALRSMRTDEGCQGGCEVSDHQCDRRLPAAVNIGQGAVQEQGDAHKFEGCSCQEAAAREGGLLEQTHKHSQKQRFSDLQQTHRCAHQLGSRVATGEGQAEAGFFSHVLAAIQEFLRSPVNFLFRRQEQQHDERFLQTGQYEAFKSPCCSEDTPIRAIISIERRDVKQEYWDMQVADTNNYVTVDGCVHHNSGKTTGAVMKIAYLASLQEKSPVDGIRRTKVVVVRNTAPQLRDTTIASFNYWFKDGVAGKWFATKNEFLLKFGDVECLVMFRALDTVDDVSRVLSLEITHAFLEEFVEIPKEILEALSGRVGRYPPKIEGGATVFGVFGSSNPGMEDSFWYDFLVENKPANVAYFHQPSGLSPDAENTANLPPNYYKNLVEGKSPAWIEVYVHANWGYSIAGKPVVPTFNRDLHVSKTNLQFNPHLPMIIGYDPGVQHSALTFGQMDLYGRLLVFDELVLEGYGAQRMAKDRLLPLLKTRYQGLEVVIAPDPAANSRTQNDETTVVEGLRRPEFRKHWTVKVDDTNLLTPRLEAIEHFTTRLTEKGPALVIDPRCKGLIRALQGGWRYKATKTGDERPEPDKNQHSHVADSLTYLARYHVKNEARVGRRGQQAPQVFPRFTNPYAAR